MDYKLHVVSRDTYERTQVGAQYNGGIVIDGIACGLTETLLLVTYHGPEGEPVVAGRVQVRSAPLAVTEAKRRFKCAQGVEGQGALDV